MATIFKGFSTVDKIRAPYSLFDQELIKRDLLNEFQTRRGERLMKPNFGSIIHDLLMEPEDTITDDSYFTQWEQDKPEQFNVDTDDVDNRDEGHEIGPVSIKNPLPLDEAENEN